MNSADTQSLAPAAAVTPKRVRARTAERARAAGEKRAIFNTSWIGVLFIMPQILLIFTFFYWPASQAIYWAFTSQSPWGGGNSWVGLDNITAILRDPVYWDTVVRSLVFAFFSTGFSMGAALVLALLVDRELTGHRIYRTVLV